MSLSEIDRIAARQHGVISREQLDPLMSSEAVDYRVRAGAFLVLHRGVYRVAGAPHGPLGRILAATLAGGKGAVASFGSALFLHGLATFTSPIHVTVATPHSNTSKGMTVHRSRRLEGETTRINGVPVTSLERTFVDMSGKLRVGPLARLIDDAIATGATTPAAIDFVARCHRGARGMKQLRLLLDERLPLADGVESRLEWRVLRILRGVTSPPVTQHVVRFAKSTFRLDIAWPHLRVALEVDGYGPHGTSRKRFDDDRHRQNILINAGWTVLHVTARMSDPEIRSAVVSALDARKHL